MGRGAPRCFFGSSVIKRVFVTNPGSLILRTQGLLRRPFLSEVCMLLFAVFLPVSTGTCGWLQVLRKAPQVTPRKSAGICRYLSILVDGCKYSVRLCGAPRVLHGGLQGFAGTLRGSTGIERYLQIPVYPRRVTCGALRRTCSHPLVPVNTRRKNSEQQHTDLRLTV